MIRFVSLALVVCAAWVPTRAQSDIVDTAVGAGSFNALVAAVQAAGLEDALRGEGPLTVFAPTDDAFAQISQATLDFLFANPDALREILLYHVVAGELKAEDVVNTAYVETLSGQVALIDVNDQGVFIDDAQVTATDIEASNGVIHVIDSVIVPPDMNLVDTAVAAGGFETLISAVQAAGLADTLADGGPFTVFAPTDEAFAKLPQGTLESLLTDPAALSDILLYHVVAGRVLSADVIGLDSAATLQGSDLSISVADGVKINNANVIAVDVLASNGVIHVIDEVLLPPSGPELDIVDTAVSAGRFETLVAAVQAAGLESALRGDGPFTVFAPNDAAFAKLPEGTVEALLQNPDELARILLYHVVEGELLADDVLSRSSLQTLEGSSASITINGNVALIDDAQIIGTDILASNGVIHEIDSVILPPEPVDGTVYRVTVTNLTRGQVFSPPVAVSHSDDIALFELGQPASDGLAELAEDGGLSGLSAALSGSDLIYDVAAFDGPIGPGESASTEVVVASPFRQVSVAGMLTSTNDSFFAMETPLPTGLFGFDYKRGGSVSELALAYDAGSEANNELCAFVPGSPCGSAGVRATDDAEGYVYISSGVHGVGDLDAARYDWRGPVARVVIERR